MNNLLAKYGEWVFYLIRLSGPGAKTPAPGKRPLDKSWPKLPAERKESAVDIEYIASELELHLEEGGNIGFAVPKEVIVLDFDANDDLERALNALHLLNIHPPVQKSSRGGHVVFKLDPFDAKEIKSTTKASVDKIAVDIRKSGSQIVVEPSIHINGERYTWQKELPDSWEKLPDLPETWIPQLKSGRKGNQKSKSEKGHFTQFQDGSEPEVTGKPPSQSPTPTSNEVLAEQAKIDGAPQEIGQSFSEGQRHMAALKLAGKYTQMGLKGNEVSAILGQWNAQNNPPMPDAELKKVIDYCLTEESKKGTGQEPENEDDRMMRLQTLSDKLGVQVLDIRRIMGDPVQWQFIVSDRQGKKTPINLRWSVVESQKKFSGVIADTARIRLTKLNTTGWNKHIDEVLALVEDLDPGKEATVDGEYSSWLSNFINSIDKPIRVEEKEKAPIKDSFIKDGHLWFSLLSFGTFVRTALGIRGVNQRELAQWLRSKDKAKKKIVACGDEESNVNTTRSVWGISVDDINKF